MKKLYIFLAFLASWCHLFAQVGHFAHFTAGTENINTCVNFLPFYGKCYVKLDIYDTLLVADGSGSISQRIPGVRALYGTAGSRLITMLPQDPLTLRSIDVLTGHIDTIPVADSLAASFAAAEPAGQDGHQLFFRLSNGVGWSLWRTDGTITGTYRVFAAYHDYNTPAQLGMADSALYFFSQRSNVIQLWRSTGATTAPVYTFDSGTYVSYQPQYRYDGSHLFFFMSDGLYRFTLSTGIAERFWQDIPPTYGAQLFIPTDSGRFIFHGLFQYYSTDGTAAGTRPFHVPIDSADLHNLYYITPTYLGAAGQTHILSSFFTRCGLECYTDHGDSAHLLLDANKGMADFPTWNALSASFDGHLYLTADDGRTGRELWRLDGTSTGYEQMADLTPGADGTNFTFMALSDSSLYTIVTRPDHVFDIYRISHGAASQRAWQPVPDQLRDEWTELITPRQSYDGQLIPEDMATHGSDIYFVLNNYRSRMQFCNNNVDITGGPVNVVKMDHYGRLQWVADIDHNANNFLYDVPKAVTADQRGCTVISTAWQKVQIGSDSITTPYALSYMARFSADSGKLLWLRAFNETRYMNDFQWATAIDAAGQIYVGTNYETGIFHCQGWTLTSPLSPTNVLMKFDETGNLIWARNLLTPWLDKYGRFRKLVVDEHRQRLYTIISQNEYHTASSCAFDSSKFYIACMDTTGAVIWSESIAADDLASAMTLDMDTDIGELIIQGKFRGHLQLGAHTLSSYESGDCTAYLPYYLRLSATDGHILAASTSPHPEHYPYCTVAAGGYLYTLTTSDHDTVTHATSYLPDGKSRTTIYRSTMTGIVLDSITFLRGGTMRYDDFSFTPFLQIDSEGYLLYFDCYTGLFDTISPSTYCSERNSGASLTRTRFASHHLRPCRRSYRVAALCSILILSRPSFSYRPTARPRPFRA